ncbi:MAG: hypothetical protein QOE31_1023 [Solirubrobacteraceae bacterium]|nr:hypothetical protein [Solirubrobacteraceae bacterium]
MHSDATRLVGDVDRFVAGLCLIDRGTSPDPSRRLASRPECFDWDGPEVAAKGGGLPRGADHEAGDEAFACKAPLACANSRASSRGSSMSSPSSRTSAPKAANAIEATHGDAACHALRGIGPRAADRRLGSISRPRPAPRLRRHRCRSASRRRRFHPSGASRRADRCLGRRLRRCRAERGSRHRSPGCPSATLG